ncbi:glycosyltransferase [Planktosalinus lacus]|uniref:Glycosyltransferase n=1 Tax=Planktosalinus lacus TaxID=1526573 RepID=A0A8J2V871_9FLAO|nr:glycosyltransferase [Planktosalinus lacus]GGD84829.1 hypothetical protein GCM10011312_06070 [Planktosalinus lacus]
MKILHITYSNKGGAGIAAERLFKAMQQTGLEVAFLSKNKTVDFEGIEIEDPFFGYKKSGLFSRTLTKIKKMLFPGEKEKHLNAFNKLKPLMHFEIATLPYSRFDLMNHPLVQKADIIHLHWVAGLIDYPTFFEYLKKPLVWTLHDMNPFLGLFHYKGDMINNASIAGKLDKEIIALKQGALKSVKNAAIVCPSNWMLSHARDSGVFNHFKSVCISNTLDFDQFFPQDQAVLRNKYDLDKDAFVLLFVADGLKSPRKGMDLLFEALKNIETPLKILTIGKGELPEFKHHQLREFGKILQPDKMAEIYNLANAVVLPSREDNLPNVLLEALACGLPVIAFNSGGTFEHLYKEKTGILAEEFTGTSLATAILSFLNQNNSFMSEEITGYAQNQFHFNTVVKQYQKLYDNLNELNNEKE